ncbi:hypothetical protein IF1G_04913 [Cordyceps javanica]|uniref:Uncharacterized protein n=1 Tax=Cordyceps javanica TaxID=43265 RepID=A0A545V3P2_9HYPO|nr:hypothetical protein IF1G_04913 [Cordyceps javanica]
MYFLELTSAFSYLLGEAIEANSGLFLVGADLGTVLQKCISQPCLPDYLPYIYTVHFTVPLFDATSCPCLHVCLQGTLSSVAMYRLIQFFTTRSPVIHSLRPFSHFPKPRGIGVASQIEP